MTTEAAAHNGRPVRVMAAGVFDILHAGHIHYLQEARSHGDELIVVIATDASVTRRKRAPVTPEALRARIVGALRTVDEAVVGHPSDHYKTVEQLRPDIIALGHDDGHDPAEIERECLLRGIEVRVVRCSRLDEELAGTSRILERIAKLRGHGGHDQ